MTSEQDQGRTVHGVEQLRRLTPPQVEQLRSHWIKTVEELLSLAATPAGRTGLAQWLGLSPEQLAEVTREATDLVGPAVTARLAVPQRGGPTGALLTEEQKRNLGQA